jgi:outer membrane protein assembly factor BamB
VNSPVVSDGVVYVGSLDDKVHALNASTGAVVLTYTTCDVVISSTAVANGVLYVGSYDHLVYAFGPSPKAQTCSVLPSLIVLSLLTRASLLLKY